MEKPVIFLVANRNSVLLKGVPIVLSGGISIKSLSDEHLGLLIGFRQSLTEVVNPKKKCVLIPHDHDIFKNHNLPNINIAISFALTFFAKEGAIACDRVFTTEKKKKLRISEEIILSNRILTAAANDTDFRISETAAPGKINTVFSSCLNSILKEKSFKITIERFISSVVGEDLYSKIIDISISLESLFSGNQEIKFRFSLFNSIISTTELEKRNEVYDLMRMLYDARSAIVHGDEIKNKEKLEVNWQKITDIAKLAIVYKMSFLDARPLADWNKHLERLALGTEQRLG